MTTPKNRSVESYKHKFAKKTLVQWFRSAAQEAGVDNCASVGEIGWRVNRSAPTWGVYEEYPVNRQVMTGWNVMAWDETGLGGLPSFQDLIDRNTPPDIIFDVAIQRKGLITYAFEVVHRNPVTQYKAEYINNLGLWAYTIDAEWILRQVDRPNKLQFLSEFGGFVSGVRA